MNFDEGSLQRLGIGPAGVAGTGCVQFFDAGGQEWPSVLH